MRAWLRRIRAALGMGLTWAIAWAPIGILIGLVVGGNAVTPDGFPADDWLMPFVVAGFLGGTVFSGVLRLMGRSRRFDELSLPRFGAWGALGGGVLGGLLLAWWSVDSGWGPISWEGALATVGGATAMAALSASGTLAIARKAEASALLDSGDDVDSVGLTEDETRELLG